MTPLAPLVRTLGAGLAVGVVHIALTSAWLREPSGAGGVTLFLGSVFCTAILWVMLALRTLANDGPPRPELEDGLTVTAAAAWVIALLPPRASNFLLEGATDDFAFAYLPMSLVIVFVMLVAQKLWPARAPAAHLPRFFLSLSVGALVLGALVVTVARGPGATELFARSAVVSLISAGCAAAFHARARRA